MPIYTKTGDDGTTAIFTKKDGRSIRISKSDSLIEAIGAVDGANSYFGIITSEIKQKTENKSLAKNIEEIQRDLFTVGAILAGANFELKKLRTEELEKEMDRMEKELPKITGFILPGGSEVSAHLMYARTLVRRAERRIVALTLNSYPLIHNSITKYINRLSDYLFVLARWVNHQSKIKELKWKTK